jgi:hypothetical protein
MEENKNRRIMKLQFENNEYYLMKDGEELAVATTDQSFIDELGAMKLSKQNCDAIYCEAINYGYDLDEIEIEIEMREDYLTWKQSDIEKMSDCLVPKLDENGCIVLRKL